MRARLAGLNVDLDNCVRWNPMRALGNGGLGGWPPASWKAWPHSTSRPTATHPLRPACPSSDEERLAARNPEIGCRSATPGNSTGQKSTTTSASAVSIESCRFPKSRSAACLAPRENIEAVAYDTPSVGWRGRRVNTLALWTAHAADPLKLEAFNHATTPAPWRTGPR